MGSKRYMYKGFLDKLAARAFSDTNAWTDTDSTVYTLESAGWAGFATILPVYLDHVIAPTLTDAACYTEVHHVNGTGHDAGVVYSEMQGTENESTSLMDLKTKRLIYPESVGFRYDTGGLMERLRVLTADRVREFHREMYQPRNLRLVIVGEVDHSHLLRTLDDFEDGILQDVPRLDEPFRRPWLEAGKTPPLQESTTETIEFPEEDESMGEILITYIGPDCNDDLQSVALDIFLVYICGSSVSLLENVIVEKEQLASAVFYGTVFRPDVLIEFTLSGVETEKLGVVERRFFEVLRDAVVKPLDMEYMEDCVRRSRRQLKFVAENSGKHFADDVIYDHLYGARDGSQLKSIANLKEHDILEKWSEGQWRDFFHKWFIRAHHVTVLGKPSKSLSERLEQEEENRVERQQEDLGEDGLRRLAQKLECAKGENDREIPVDLLRRFPVPDPSSVHFIHTITALAGLARLETNLKNAAQQKIDTDTDDPSLYLHYEHIPTNFVSLGLLMNTHAIPEELRPLLAVYTINFFDTPITRNGARVEYEDVVTQLERDTVSFNIGNGSADGNAELLRIGFQVEPERYSTAIQWIKTMLLDSIFDVERLVSSVVKLLAAIPEEKRSGNDMAYCVANLVNMSSKSTVRAQNTLVKERNLRRILKQLENEPDSVISKFEKMREIVAKPSNFRVFVLGDLESGRLEKPVSSWKSLSDAGSPNNALRPLDSIRDTLSEAGRSPGNSAFIVPMRTIDSSFAVLTCRGLDSFDHPRLPALAVAQAYLDAVEGPLWAAVRGTGLAYGTGFSRSVSSGLLQFRIYRSPDAYKAFETSKKTVEDLARGIVEIDDLALESAMSSIVVGFADEQPTMLSAASAGFANQVVKSIAKDWGGNFMKEVSHVGKEEMKMALTETILPVFEANTSNLVATCASIMEEKLVKGFEGRGFRPEVKPLSSFKNDYDTEGPDEDEDEDEDGDEAEDEDGDDNEDEESEGED